MFWATDWTATPLGMIDAWIYRALGHDFVNAQTALGDYYYLARPFVLVPRYLLTRVFLEDVANTLYGVLCAQLLLLAVVDFLSSVARRGTVLPGVLLFGTCLYLLRSLGWGYVDGSILTWFMVGLAGVARWHRRAGSPRARSVGALLAGGCFAAMLSTHPMTAPMLLTPLLLIISRQRRRMTPRPWAVWGVMLVGGLLTVGLMGVCSRALHARFFYFMPIVEEAVRIRSAEWRTPFDRWLFDANWLMLVGFACGAALVVLAMARLRKTRLTWFERFAALNVLSLMTLMGLLERFTPSYWLEYTFFSSYFLPAGLFMLAALLAERRRGAASVTMRLAWTAVFVLVTGAVYRLEVPHFLHSMTPDTFPFRTTVRVGGTWSLAAFQLALSALVLIAVGVWRAVSSRPGPRAMLVTSALLAVVTGGAVNRVAPGDADEVEGGASAARAIALIQEELAGKRPTYWYDQKSPLRSVFLSIASAHLASYSSLPTTYPEGAKSCRVSGYGERTLFQEGDWVVVLDGSPNRLPRAKESFAEVGLELVEQRRQPMHFAGYWYWILFARLETRTIHFPALEAASNLSAPELLNGERISAHEPGFLSFGPYLTLGPGRYRLTFHLRLMDQVNDEALGWVDVGNFTDGQKSLASQVLKSSAARAGVLDTVLEFSLEQPTQKLEFRTFSKGTSRLALGSIDLKPLVLTRAAN